MRSCCRYRLAGKPVRVSARRYTRAIARSAPSFISLCRNIIPRSRPTWRRRARSCRGMWSRSSRLTSSAAALSTGSCGCAATPVMPSIWSPSAAKSAVFVRAVGRGAWPTSAVMHEVEQCRSNCRERRAAGGRGVSRTARASVGVECPVSVAFPVREPPSHHGPGVGHRLPLHRHPPDSRRSGFPVRPPRPAPSP